MLCLSGFELYPRWVPLKGVLVDTYVAEEMKEFSNEELRINKIIDHNTMELYLERDDCQKRPFRTASSTEFFEIVKAKY